MPDMTMTSAETFTMHSKLLLPLNESSRLIGLIEVLHPTRQKIGYFRDVLPSLSLGLVLEKLD